MIRNPRGGKVAAQDSAVRQTESDVVAFSDANCTWAPDALRKLVRSFADPEVAYVCGRLNLESGDGGNKEGLYWRFELALRADESRIDSVTGGNGSIYAVRREDYLEVDPRFGHDLSFPYRMVQRGKRAVYEQEANAYEKTTPTNEDEYRRKVRMFEHCWAIVVEGKMLRRLRPLYFVEVVSHRHLRYASGLLHVVLLGSTVALLGEGPLYQIALGLQLGLLAAAALGVGVARYYVLVSWATLEALVKYLRRGVPTTWEAAEGTRENPRSVADERGLDQCVLRLGDDRLPDRLTRDTGLDDAIGRAAELLHFRLDEARGRRCTSEACPLPRRCSSGRTRRRAPDPVVPPNRSRPSVALWCPGDEDRVRPGRSATLVSVAISARLPERRCRLLPPELLQLVVLEQDEDAVAAGPGRTMNGISLVIWSR